MLQVYLNCILMMQLDSHHSMDSSSQYDTIDEDCEPRFVWLAGLYYTGDIHQSIPYMA